MSTKTVPTTSGEGLDWDHHDIVATSPSGEINGTVMTGLDLVTAVGRAVELKSKGYTVWLRGYRWTGDYASFGSLVRV